MDSISKPKTLTRINNRNEKIAEKGKDSSKRGNVGNIVQSEKKFSQFQTPAKVNKLANSNFTRHIPTPRPTKFASLRKSNSSMEFRPVQHRQMNMLVASPYPYDKKVALSQIGNSQGAERDRSFYYVLQESDPKKAGMKIFNCIMLNAWRKRRDEVKQLNKELIEMKRISIKTKNQLHVINSLFHVESKRNEEMSSQLKRSMEELQYVKSTCECLETTAECLKMDKIYLQSQLESREKEVRLLKDNVQCLITELEQNKCTQDELRRNLEEQEIKLDRLENSKNQLINDLCELTQQLKELRIEHDKEMEDKKLELENCAEEKLNLKIKVEKLEEKLTIIPKLKSNEEDLLKTIAQLKRDVETLQCCLAATLSNRIKNCLSEAFSYPKTTFHMLHWLAFYLLPATPPPRISTIPFRLSLQKAISIVRR